jgi:hypothetical protein
MKIVLQKALNVDRVKRLPWHPLHLNQEIIFRRKPAAPQNLAISPVLLYNKIRDTQPKMPLTSSPGNIPTTTKHLMPPKSETGDSVFLYAPDTLFGELPKENLNRRGMGGEDSSKSLGSYAFYNVTETTAFFQ